MEKYLLENGLVAYYYHMPYAYSTSIGLYVGTGARGENQRFQGITHLLEHMHFRQLGDLDGCNLNLILQKKGVSFNATTYADYVRFFMKFRPEHLDLAASLFVDLIKTENWTEEQLEAEKKVVINQILERGEDENFNDIVRKTLWKRNNLSRRIIGTLDSVTGITLKKLLDYKRILFRKDNLALCITGNFNAGDILNINSQLSAIDLGHKDRKLSYKSPQIGFRKPDIKLVNWGGDYLDVNLSFDTDLKIATNEELTLLNCIIGGGDGSILVNELRERVGITSNIFSEVTFYCDVAMLNITFNILKKDLKQGLIRIVSILNQLKIRIEDDDISTSLPFYTSNLWYWLEDPEWLNHILMWQVFVRKLPEFTIEGKIKLFESITAKKLNNISRDLFRVCNASIVIVGNLDRISEKSIRDILLNLNTD